MFKDAYERAKEAHKASSEARSSSVSQIAESKEPSSFMLLYGQARALQQERRREEDERQKIEAQEKTKPGFIYFLLDKAPVDGPRRVKIGFSESVPHRLKQANTWGPYGWQIIGVIHNVTKTDEGELHDRFRRYRAFDASGVEWFYLAGELKNFIENSPTVQQYKGTESK